MLCKKGGKIILYKIIQYPLSHSIQQYKVNLPNKKKGFATNKLQPSVRSHT